MDCPCSCGDSDDREFGLAAAIWTKNGRTSDHFLRKVRTGTEFRSTAMNTLIRSLLGGTGSYQAQDGKIVIDGNERYYNK